MEKLIILTVEWPFGKGETFFENEASYSSGFDEIYCMPFYRTGTQRSVPADIGIISNNKINRILDTLQGCLTKEFFSEIGELIKSRRFSFYNLKTLARVSMMANSRYRAVKNWLGHNLRNNDSITVYTYWMASDAVAVARLKESGVPIKLFITRCHRFDLYEQETEGKYIPYRRFILNKVDRVMAISNNGIDYLKNNYSVEYCDKYYVSRLGTLEHGLNPEKSGHEGTLTIVSCSNLIKVKRVDIMLNALKKTSRPINWIHFGDGILRQELEEMAKSLPAGAAFTFKGRVSNENLMDWYSKNHVDLFVNTSESEGIPVSIMEAMSFGIPVMATDVGGSGEIVKNGENGFLVNKAITPEELAHLLDEFAGKKDEQVSILRASARSFWEENYCADKNYVQFYQNYLK